jgi:glycosyltransferase involved in cell wall biosynthesis
MKITVATPRFAIAGVPLAQIRFARALAKRGHQVTLLVGFVEPDFQFPALSGLTVRVLNTPKVRSMLWPLVRYLHSEKPDVVFSAEDHLNTLILIAAMLARSKSKFSCSSRVTPFDTYSSNAFSKGWLLKQLTRITMSRADVLTCVSKDMVSQYQQIFGQCPHVCVYNIVGDTQAQERMHERLDHPWLADRAAPTLLAAGKLAPWKGFGDLIDAIDLVRTKRPVRLLILGDGPLRGELQTRIEAKGLADCVQLIGYVDNPLKYFFRADIFVLSSHVEGLPNVLVEAMLCGCTPVATDCPTGPREVLEDGRYGYLVKPCDPSSIADGILKALNAPISADILEMAVRPFEEDAVISHHFDLLGLPERVHAKVGLN